MSHYWLMMFWPAPSDSNGHKWGNKWDKYRDWDEAARKWGNGTDYLERLNETFNDRKVETGNTGKPLYPLIEHGSVIFPIPKNYRPPSKYAESIPVNDHLYNSDLGNCTTTDNPECIMNCMHNKFCPKRQKNISRWDAVMNNVTNWNWTGESFSRIKECREKELFDMKTSNVECLSNAISISRNSTSSKLCFKFTDSRLNLIFNSCFTPIAPVWRFVPRNELILLKLCESWKKYTKLQN